MPLLVFLSASVCYLDAKMALAGPIKSDIKISTYAASGTCQDTFFDERFFFFPLGC